MAIETFDDFLGFLKSYHAHWMADPGLPESSIPANIPDPLAKLYRHLGRLISQQPEHSPFVAQDSLVGPENLELVDGMFTIVGENQGNWSVRCPAGTGNPPVFSDAIDGSDGFVEVCDSLEHFLITFCLQEALFSSPVVITREDSDALDGFLTVPVKPLWQDGYYVWAEPTHTFYHNAEKDILIMDYSGLWLGTHSTQTIGCIAPDIKTMRIH